MNVVAIKGELQTVIEKHITKDGVSQVTFRIKVKRDFKDRLTGNRESDSFQVVAWRQQADFLAQYARKGDEITVKGVLQNRVFEREGIKHMITEINADRVELDRRETAMVHDTEKEQSKNE